MGFLLVAAFLLWLSGHLSGWLIAIPAVLIGILIVAWIVDVVVGAISGNAS